MADLLIQQHYHTRRWDATRLQCLSHSFYCRICDIELGRAYTSVSSRHNLCRHCALFIRESPPHHFQQDRCHICDRHIRVISQAPENLRLAVKATCHLCAVIASITPIKRKRCGFCHWALESSPSEHPTKEGPGACGHCLNRIRLKTMGDASSRLEFFYCSICSWEMFPPSTNSLPRFGRICHICNDLQHQEKANDAPGPEEVYCQHCCSLLGSSPALRDLLRGRKVNCLDCYETEIDERMSVFNATNIPASPPPSYSKFPRCIDERTANLETQSDQSSRLPPGHDCPVHQRLYVLCCEIEKLEIGHRHHAMILPSHLKRTYSPSSPASSSNTNNFHCFASTLSAPSSVPDHHNFQPHDELEYHEQDTLGGLHIPYSTGEVVEQLLDLSIRQSQAARLRCNFPERRYSEARYHPATEGRPVNDGKPTIGKVLSGGSFVRRFFRCQMLLRFKQWVRV
jgi:hypothetical protein